MKILILEDVPEMAELIRITLEAIPDLEVKVVHTVLEARRVLLKDRPDFLLLDEIIPNEAPLELLGEPGLAGVRVALISASDPGAKPLPAGVMARIKKWGWKDLGTARSRVLELLNQG
ncbi:MAG: response regulator [Oligoflexia bacterium]|jgi:response regulator of citrate/malate metabolism